MPWQLRLFTLMPMLVLAARICLSRDRRWKRLAAAAFLLAALLAVPVLMHAVDVREPWSAGYNALLWLQGVALFGSGLVLLLWSFATRDPLWQRLVSFAVGLFGLGPFLITLIGSLPAIFASAHEGAN